MGARLRGRRGEHAVYFDHQGAECTDAKYHKHCRGRWRGEISLGYGPDGRRIRKKASGSTKTAVRRKLTALQDELADGIRPSAAYTVQAAIVDWLAGGLSRQSARTVRLYTDVLRPVTKLIGKKPIRELTARPRCARR